MNAAPQIKGWCPSAWRPMLTGDGYLMRLRFSCGILSSEQGRAIATLAQCYGNGLIDLTRRANLQIRGVAEDGIEELQRELLARNLIAPDTQGVDAPNVIASPLAGRDRAALLDIRPLVRELEQRLASEPDVRDLPAKFCIAVEDGGRFSLKHIRANIAFEAGQQDGQIRFAVRVDALSLADLVFPTQLVDVVLELIGAPQPRDSGSHSASLHAPDDVIAAENAVDLIADDVFGVAAPFGSLKADQLALLAELADGHAEGELRLTTRRSVLIPAIASGANEQIEDECARAGLITEPSDPRRHVAACTGAPGCTSASVATRDIAASLASLLPRHDTLHVSGCAKSCASSAAASVTLVGRDGRFDLVRNGKAGDAPLLFGLSAAEARAAVQRIAAEELAHV